MTPTAIGKYMPAIVSISGATALGFGFLAAVIYSHPYGKAHRDAVPQDVTELVVYRVGADLTRPDPDAKYWDDAREGAVVMTAQPWVAPRPESTQTDRVYVKAVSDGDRVAFRMRWKDADRSEAGRLGEYSDALAMGFPIHDDPLPPVAMGGKGMPVHIFHWRAQYQRDRDKGKPTMKDLYPNHSIDMYPMDFREAPSGSADQKEAFSPGRVAGNPQSYEKTGVDEIIAEGFATSSVQAGNGSVGHAEWRDGEWTLVIVRPLAIQGGSVLKRGGKGVVSFAAWQGGKGEVGSRKSVTMSWIPVTVQ